MILRRQFVEKRSWLGGPEVEVSSAQFWFERGVRWAIMFALGFGVATAFYGVPDLKARDEFLNKLVHGKYPGIQVTTTDCRPVKVN